MIHVTETAASKITELLAEEQKDGSGLRVFVQGGGCSGTPCRRRSSSPTVPPKKWPS
jgi:Fe-S cluster assembly iron-binding protein IscA